MRANCIILNQAQSHYCQNNFINSKPVFGKMANFRCRLHYFIKFAKNQMFLESLDRYLPTGFVMDERTRAQRTFRSRPDEHSRAHFRIVKISRTKCLVGWPNVNQSRNPVIVDVVQKFYFLMFTGINV